MTNDEKNELMKLLDEILSPHAESIARKWHENSTVAEKRAMFDRLPDGLAALSLLYPTYFKPIEQFLGAVMTGQSIVIATFDAETGAKAGVFIFEQHMPRVPDVMQLLVSGFEEIMPAPRAADAGAPVH